MYIKNIKLQNFRNYNNLNLDLNKNINIFFGNNAQGKTNLIESVYLCSLGRSFRTRKDKELINFRQNDSQIELDYSRKDRDGNIKIDIKDKKYIELNGVKNKKISEILGNINVIIFSPDDLEILKQGPVFRRRFLDMMISSLRPNYLFILTQYMKNLEQRNFCLRQIRRENKQDYTVLDIWDEKIADLGYKIYCYRKEFINKINEKIKVIHNEITNCEENIDISYITDCKDKEKYLKNIKSSRQIDILKGFTTKGIHRDDLIFYINSKPVSVYGSQGQSRTSILSLKLAELNVVYEEIGEYPILLLDDVMSELDEKRRNKLIESIRDYQVLITCTDKEDLEKYSLDISYFKVEEGKIKKM